MLAGNAGGLKEMTVELVKIVLLSLPTQRAAALVPTEPRPGQPTAFAQFWRTHLSPLRYIAAPDVAEVAERIPPDDPAGAAYRDGLLEAQALSDGDTWRTFDLVRGWDPYRADLLDELADRLEERSPLLTEVADLARSVAPVDPVTFGDVAQIRSRVTDDVLGIGPLTDRDGAMLDPAGLVPWADNELLLPGTRENLTDLIDGLFAAVPTDRLDADGESAGSGLTA